MKTILLIGFMGSGKSSVSKCLERMTGLPVVDTDTRIEQEQGMSITHIFELYGESYFRQLEGALLKKLAEHPQPCIVSAGGGLPIHLQYPEVLKRIGTTVFLKVSEEEVLRRLAHDTTRPLLQGTDKRAKVRGMLAERVPVYEKLADVIVETDGKTTETIAAEILAGMEEEV